MLKDDSVIMLEDAELPVMSFAFTCLFGAAGSGKTYVTEKLDTCYVNQGKKHVYDLD